MYRPRPEEFDDIAVAAAHGAVAQSDEPMKRPDHKAKKHGRPKTKYEYMRPRSRATARKSAVATSYSAAVTALDAFVPACGPLNIHPTIQRWLKPHAFTKSMAAPLKCSLASVAWRTANERGGKRRADGAADHSGRSWRDDEGRCRVSGNRVVRCCCADLGGVRCLRVSLRHRQDRLRRGTAAQSDARNWRHCSVLAFPQRAFRLVPTVATH